MRVLVTGATGQIGLAVAVALRARGDTVRTLVRDPIRADALRDIGCELVAGDVCAPDTLPAAVAGQDAVVHAAGIVSYWSRRKTELMRVNVEGTRSLLEAAVAHGVGRFLLTSSIATLGWLPDGAVGDEDTTWNWDGLGIDYFVSKRLAEDAVLAERRIETLAVNPGIVFGPGDVSENGLRMLLNVAEARVPGLPPGATTVAVLDDVVTGHLAALDHGAPYRRTVLGGHTLSFVELFERIGAVVGRAPPRRLLAPWEIRLSARFVSLGALWTGREPKLTPALAEIVIRNRRYRSDRAVDELGLRFSPLESGIEALWDWHHRRMAGLAEVA